MQRLSHALNAYRKNRFLTAFNLLFLGTAALYRIALAISVVAAEAAPFGAEKGVKTFVLIILALANDVVVLLALNGIFLAGFIAVNPSGHAYHAREARRKHALVFAGFLFLVLWHIMISGSHFHLLFTMNTGFTLALFLEFFTILNLRDFLTLLSIRDFITILVPLTAFILLWRRGEIHIRKKHIALTVLAVSVVLFFASSWGMKRIPDEIRMNPHAFFLRDTFRTLFSRFEAAKEAAATAKVYLDDPLLVKNRRDDDDQLSSSREYANVVVIVLESTSSEYIFDTTKYASGKMPMPYLHSLTDKSLYMTRHFASNNSSPRSIFSIFSGLYESPQIQFYSMEKQLKVPHFIDYLGKRYDAFLVTPADINWYFPKAWFKNRGFHQIYDYNALKNLPEYKAGPTAVRDEFSAVNFFLQQVQATKKPFLGVYYTFVGHWPYADLAEEHQLIAASSARSRYINNLYAQDKVIRQIITGMEKTGKADDTIFVIVGDHGEAFYQHPGNRVHSGESYNENITSPLIIYSPRYVKIRRIDFPTVHADIVPTVLDVLGVDFKKDQFQGESILTRPRRRYIFSYGNENTLTAVSTDLKKMQILRKDGGGCRYFDLKQDGAELNNLGCQAGSDHYRAIETFFRIQPGILKGYNELCNRQGC